MSAAHDTALFRLTAGVLGEQRAEAVLRLLAIDPELLRDTPEVSRAQLAMALNAILYAGLLDRVPTAAAYVAEVGGAGLRICFDHGALRTIDGPAGALPRGHAAFARLLEPLGYALAGTYPLPRLRMTGRAYVHRDLPETIPQFFVSELHADLLPPEAQAAAERVFGQSRDPLDAATHHAVDVLRHRGGGSLDLAREALRGIVRAFDRHHDEPALADYHTLLRHSPEAAWIATEGNGFNHATDRVADVERLAAGLKARGLPLKPEVEVSANGRVRQTAFLADWVTRRFRHDDGSLTERSVPGSFYEFITRDIDPATGKLDLSFDSGNATGIFAVTAAP